jgi:putative ABC transport system permease protein
VPLIAGRRLLDSDDSRGRRVALVDERLASTFFQGEDPVGGAILDKRGEAWTIVGVVGSVRAGGLAGRDEAPYQLWLPQDQMRDKWFVTAARNMTLLARTKGQGTLYESEIVTAAASVNRDQAIYSARPMDDLLQGALAQERTSSALLVGFAVIALALAVVGLYAVVSDAVSRRTREIAVRLALGASPGALVWSVVSRALVLVGAGLLIGVIAAGSLADVVARFVPGQQILSPSTLLVVSGVLALAAVLASLGPAIRATSIDPALALRDD